MQAQQIDESHETHHICVRAIHVLGCHGNVSYLNHAMKLGSYSFKPPLLSSRDFH